MEQDAPASGAPNAWAKDIAPKLIVTNIAATACAFDFRFSTLDLLWSGSALPESLHTGYQRGTRPPRAGGAPRRRKGHHTWPIKGVAPTFNLWLIMRMPRHEFAKILVELRRGAGFDSPHAFYSKKGGKRVLGFSYVNYWKIERGQILPKSERLGIILSCLGVAFESPEAEKLVKGYLKDLLGSETAYDWFVKVLGGPKTPAPAQTLADKALKHAVHGDLHHLTPRQNQILLTSYATYWGFVLLCVERSPWNITAMAVRLGLKKPELVAALKLLVGAKLAKLLPNDEVVSPLAGRHVKFLPHQALSDAEKACIQEYQQRMIKENGTLLRRTYSIPRAQEMEMGSYYPHLVKAIDAVHVYSSCEKAPGTALFLVEGNVYRLMPA